jgi:hypothetical protein
MRVIVSKEETASAQDRFATAISSRGRQTSVVAIGYQSGHFKTSVFWLPEFSCWAYFGLPPKGKSHGKRYWNVFGLEVPSGSVSIACEINPPLSGTNRRTAGVFLRDSAGRLHIGHRGLINAGGRIEKAFVFSNFAGKKITVEDAGRMTQILYVGQLDDPDFPVTLRDFVAEVVRIKELVRHKRGA